MNIREARAAIEEILASIPDEEMPLYDSIEIEPDRVTVWWGGRGRCLGTARTGGKRNPMRYREGGSWDAIEGEMAYRADAAFLANGDRPDGLGLDIARRVVKA